MRRTIPDVHNFKENREMINHLIFNDKALIIDIMASRHF